MSEINPNTYDYHGVTCGQTRAGMYVVVGRFRFKTYKLADAVARFVAEVRALREVPA